MEGKEEPKPDDTPPQETQAPKKLGWWGYLGSFFSKSEIPPPALSADDEKRKKILEYLKIEDPKGSVPTINRARLRKRILEQKQKEKDEATHSKGSSFHPEQDERWTSRANLLTWRPSWDTELEALVELEKKKLLDEAKAKSKKSVKIEDVAVVKIDKSEKQIPEIFKEDEKIPEPQPIPKPEPKPKPKPMMKKKMKKRPDIFGYLSKLNSPTHIIYKDKEPICFELPETKLMEENGEESVERDMTWLLQLSSATQNENNENEEPIGYFNTKTQDSTERSTWLFWLFLLIGGRMPFHFVRSYNPSDPRIKCEMNRRRFNYYTFVISSIFLICVTLISIVNLVLILAEKEVKGDPHNQLEKLLFEKNEASAWVFLTSLILASITSISVLINGESIANYMTLWAKTLEEFNFKATPGIMALTIIYIVWSTSLFLGYVTIFWITNSDPNPNAFIEAIHLKTAIVFRSFVPNILIQIVEIPGSKAEIRSSDQLWKYGAFIVCLNAYALYCARNFVIMIVVCSIGITNFASEWNFRLRMILGQIHSKRNEIFVRILEDTINYQKMFEWHQRIVHLIHENSKVFRAILFTFYLAVAISLAAELLEVAIYTVGQKRLNFNLNETAEVYEFQNSSGHFVYLCFNICQTIGIFLFVSLCLAQTGIETMSGLIPLTKHNYMTPATSRRRKFFMSLSMSFSARKPHILGAGGIFNIDRHFIVAFLALFLHFFSVMIQTQHPRILTFPILVECPPKSGQYDCTAIKHLAENKIEDHFNSLTLTTTTTTTSTPTPTSTTLGPDICLLTDGQGQFVGITIEVQNAYNSRGQLYPRYNDTCIVRKNSGVQKPYALVGLPGGPLDLSGYGFVGTGLRDMRRDSCFNLPFHNIITKVHADQKAVKVESKSAGRDYVLCCYDYGYTNGQIKFCNQQTYEAIDLACGIDPTQRNQHPFRFDDLEDDLQKCINSGTPQCSVVVNECFCSKNPKAKMVWFGSARKVQCQ